MVLPTCDWERFCDYVANCRVGSYRVRDVVDGVKVTVMAGQFGFYKMFPPIENRSTDQVDELAEIVRFCELHGFMKVEANVPDEQFHS